MYDVIIAGGGPSGTSAGRRAGKLGLNTLLLEKEGFPRYKLCGVIGISNFLPYFLRINPLNPKFRATKSKFLVFSVR